MGTEHRDEYLISPEGQRLFCQCWLPAQGTPRGLVVASHGRGEHSGRYRDFGLALSRAGLAACFYDCRGHGRSDGEPRGHVLHIEHYLDDLRFFLGHCLDDYPDMPVALFGHSQGALLNIALAQGELPARVKTLALVSPFLGLGMPVPLWKDFLGRIMARLYPRLSMPAGYDGTVLSHDPQVQASFASDPLVVHTVTAGWYRAISEAQLLINAHPERIALPVLIIAAADDKLVSNEATRAFAQRLRAEHELHVAAGSYHEVLNEPAHKEQVTAQLIAWINRHFAG